MNLNNVIFYERYSKLDLHGYDQETARVAICDFISDSMKLKQEVVVIVHGIGSGKIMRTTQEVLKRHKDVLDYKSSFNNRGCTLVLLNKRGRQE